MFGVINKYLVIYPADMTYIVQASYSVDIRTLDQVWNFLNLKIVQKNLWGSLTLLIYFNWNQKSR